MYLHPSFFAIILASSSFGCKHTLSYFSQEASSLVQETSLLSPTLDQIVVVGILFVFMEIDVRPINGIVGLVEVCAV